MLKVGNTHEETKYNKKHSLRGKPSAIRASRNFEGEVVEIGTPREKDTYALSKIEK
jgi:hypothetical protein